MVHLVNTVLIAAACVSLFAALYHSVAIARIFRVRRGCPSLDAPSDAAPPEGGWPSVCVVVPAHNEQDVIGELVASLRAQDYPNLRVVLALDRCSDDTERIARMGIQDDPRVEIVAIKSCPEEWSGKTHAAWSGVVRSQGAADAEMLLFTDADTIHAPHCVRASVGLMHQRGLVFLSLLSTLTNSRWFELLVQPAVSLELMRQNPLDRVNSAERPRPFANGQFMLFTRSAYDRVGGHEAVREALLEDIAFARILCELNLPRAVYPAQGAMRCRMYRSWAQFKRGWKRIFTEATRRRAGYLRQAGWKLVASGFVMPVCAVAAVALGAHRGGALGWTALGAGVIGLAAWAIMQGIVRRTQRAPVWTLPLAPVGSLMAGLLLLEAARDLRRGLGITWAGRTYAAGARAG